MPIRSYVVTCHNQCPNSQTLSIALKKLSTMFINAQFWSKIENHANIHLKFNEV